MELNPVVPFEPTRTDEFPQGSKWIAQVKWDGVRVLTYYDEKQVRLFNRKLRERTLHYPEIAAISDYCDARSVILDGEVIALGADGKPSFYEVMRRDGLRRLEKVPVMQREVPITYMVFDILYANGKWVTSEPLEKRQQLLRAMITPSSQIQLVDNFPDAKALFEAVQGQGMEGVIIKDLTSGYLINGKDERWRKKKYYRDLIAVVGGVTLQDQIVNALLLGLYDQEGSLWYIGHAGTGKLSRTDWRNLTEAIKPLVQKESPFANRPQRLAGTVWVQPEMTVKVQFMEWVDGHSLRQPSIQGIVDVPPRSCVFEPGR